MTTSGALARRIEFDEEPACGIPATSTHAHSSRWPRGIPARRGSLLDASGAMTVLTARLITGWSDPGEFEPAVTAQSWTMLFSYPASVVPQPALEPPRNSTISQSARERFRREFSALVDDESVEDGLPHPAEDFLRKAFTSTVGAVSAFCELSSDRAFKHRVALALSIGRLPVEVVGHAAPGFVRQLLASERVIDRDAGVRAAELWRTPEVLRLLREHQEPISWLADYVRRVLTVA